MTARVVFVHAAVPRVALEIGDDSYVVVQNKCQADMDYADVISGDLTIADVKWMLNITRSKLLRIQVLGRYATLERAVAATTQLTRKTPPRSRTQFAPKRTAAVPDLA